MWGKNTVDSHLERLFFHIEIGHMYKTIVQLYLNVIFHYLGILDVMLKSDIL